MKLPILDDRLEQVLFYTLEKAIKSYRQFAQRRLNELKYDITIDQWLTLKTIHDNPEISQREIASRIFKDQASVTRLIDALVQKQYLIRSSNVQDRRRFSLELSPVGEEILSKLNPVIQSNRHTALSGFEGLEISVLRSQLERIIENCNT